MVYCFPEVFWLDLKLQGAQSLENGVHVDSQAVTYLMDQGELSSVIIREGLPEGQQRIKTVRLSHPCLGLTLRREEALCAVSIKIRGDAVPDITVVDDLPDLQWSLTFR